MKISYNWLKEYYPTALTPREVAALLTGCGLEVENLEEFESVKGGLKGLVIGQVITCEKHPDADKLSLTSVNVGGDSNLSIVCGASNVAAGQKVVVATPGTKIFPLDGEPFIIKQAKIRGQVSQGMICAEDEIGLGNSHDGIIVLPSDAPVGLAASEYFKISGDFIFEIGLTPNRADAASHIGVARDLASVERINKLIDSGVDERIHLRIPEVVESKFTEKEAGIKFTVLDTKACIRYSGISIGNVTVKESPEWLISRLQSIGVKPVNNVVDITNYVLHECGQPLHAFDASQIAGREVVVRSARNGEPFVTLDGASRELREGDLMICDSKDSMCIAGIFGGLRSGISAKTTEIFLESACFNPESIRKTSKRLGIKTDASFRFERGTDPELTIFALKRAAAMICEMTGGNITSAITDHYPSPVKRKVVELSFSHLSKISGMVMDNKIVQTILEALEFRIISVNGNAITMEVPLFKVDVTRTADVIEEILRVYGFDRIPVPEKINSSLPAIGVFDSEVLQNKVSSYLAANGFLEILNNSLTKGDYVRLPNVRSEELIRVLNPLSQDLSIMRPSLLFSGLETIAYNLNRKQENLKLFEHGKIYSGAPRSAQESYRLSLLMTGNSDAAYWQSKEKKVDFFLMKSHIENVLALCGMEEIKMEQNDGAAFNNSLTAYFGKDKVAEFGMVSKAILKKFEIQQEVLFADFNWDVILECAASSRVKYVEVPKFPSVKRDLSMLLGDSVSYARLEEIAFRTEKKLLKEIRLFDVYAGDKVGAGKKSYALSFTLQDEQQTLTDDIIGKVMDKLMNAFEKEVGAIIRRQ